ncbi:hypothetical protein R1sor_021175 [Riccia sorocarpa]|uniref:Retrotransposon gag domain-containing protein n=1 Tax=Riccia sorocarpa TaxID=122646 RepID=A0ABD3GKI8_9MARC
MAATPGIIQPGTVAFHGVEDFNAFINMFDNICVARNITDDAAKTRQLGQMFVGSVASWYSRLAQNVKDSYTQVVAAGKAEYVPTTLHDQIKDKVDRIQKSPYETMQTYIQRFQYFTSLLSPPLSDEILLSSFKRGLPDYIHNWLTVQKVHNLTEVLADARTYAQCEERGAQIPDPTYYIPGLKGQVMVNPFAMHNPYSSPGLPFARTTPAVPMIPGTPPTPSQPPTSWFQHQPGINANHGPAVQHIETTTTNSSHIYVDPPDPLVFDHFQDHDYDSDDEDDGTEIPAHTDDTAIPLPVIPRTLDFTRVTELNNISISSRSIPTPSQSDKDDIEERMYEFREEWVREMSTFPTYPVPTDLSAQDNNAEPEVSEQDLPNYFTRRHLTEQSDVVPPRLPIVDQFTKMNISFDGEPRYLHVSTSVSPEQLPAYKALFQEYR